MNDGRVPGAFERSGSASEYGLHHGGFNPDEAAVAPAAHYFARLASQALAQLENSPPIARGSL